METGQPGPIVSDVALMMADYTYAAYADMIYIYGEAQGNGRAARRLYQERYPNRVPPVHTAFARVFQQLRETGTFAVNRLNYGTARTRCTPEFDEEIQHCIA